MSRIKSSAIFASLSAALYFAAACGGEERPAASEAAPAASGAQAAAGPLTPAPGGKIIEIVMSTDGEGNYFKPSEVHANRGDVLRFTLKVGVHNLHFVADSNVGKSGYPSAASEFLQLPGQTYDVAVTMPVGSYYYQCDPHAALGMTGRLIVH